MKGKTWKYDGDSLRNRIAKAEMSVPEFADKAKLSRFAVYRAITGSRANTRTLGKIAAALAVEPKELVLIGE